MPTLQVRVRAENAGVGVSQWAAETMGIWQVKGGLTTQRIDNKVREHVWEIAKSMSIINDQGAGPEQWDLLIDHCLTQISDLESKRPLWKRYMADKTNLNGQNLKAVQDEFAQVGLRRRKNRLEATPARKKNLLHLGMYFIAPMLLCSSWWCVYPEDDKEETSGHRSSQINVCCDTLTNFLVELFSFTIAYVDPDIAGKRVGENNTQLFSWHWPGDDKSILLIVTSIVDTTILSIVNAAIAGLSDPSLKIRELWGYLENLDGDGGPSARNVNTIFHNNTAAGWVKAVLKLTNPMHFRVVYCGQQADSTAGAQTPVHGGRNYLPLDDILPPPAEDIIDNIRHKSDNDGETWHPNPRSLPTKKTCFQKFQRELQNNIIRQQRDLEVIRNHALGFITDYKQSVVADEDVACLCKHDHIVNTPTTSSFANRKRKCSRPGAN